MVLDIVLVGNGRGKDECGGVLLSSKVPVFSGNDVGEDVREGDVDGANGEVPGAEGIGGLLL
jgi:hypothetical protein